jgi:hypothetical protein
MQVKPGMSVTANIVTQVDQNVIAVPNAAVVTSGSTSYILEPATLLSATDLASSANGGIVLSGTKEVPVTVGLANDTMTEIDSGVNVGDHVNDRGEVHGNDRQHECAPASWRHERRTRRRCRGRIHARCGDTITTNNEWKKKRTLLYVRTLKKRMEQGRPRWSF